jgi:hypothetical protein
MLSETTERSRCGRSIDARGGLRLPMCRMVEAFTIRSNPLELRRRFRHIVCTENLIRVDDVMESPKLAA